MAPGAATDGSTGTSWRFTDLRALGEHALAPHGELGARIVLDGSTVAVQPQAAVALALAQHEFATNAAKYGALSNDVGRGHLSWQVGGTGRDARFRLA